jgi:multiple sugar transport system ATP-binding protein
MAHLIIKNLEKSFGSTRVINNISFNVQEGEFCILLGPSGCGKTTVLRMIAGLEQQDSGEIFIDDKEVSNLTPKERDVAMVFQSYALYPHMTVYENMAFSLKMQKRSKNEIDQKVRETAELLGLEDFLDRKPKELSGGQRQRVAIGRAIVRNPRLFLFDEPLSNLDAKLRSSMRAELARLHQKIKATTLYVTHDQVEAMTLGEKIVLFDQGEIQQTGTPEELYDSPSSLFVAGFIGTPGINLITGTVNVKGADLFFVSGVLTLNVSHRDELRQFNSKEITVGLRPEALVQGEGPIRGSVELVEHLGSEKIVYVKAHDARLIAKAPADNKLSQGDNISLSFSNKGLHFFHKGLRISG